MNQTLIQEALKQSLEAAKQGVQAGAGGPFGAAVIHNDKIIAVAHNTVLADSDPSAHAEVNAIRKAGKVLNDHVLEQCVLVTTSDPCPMCLATIFWARIPKVIYCLKKDVAAEFGFDDALFYEMLEGKQAEHRCQHEPSVEHDCIALFKMWQEKAGQIY